MLVVLPTLGLVAKCLGVKLVLLVLPVWVVWGKVLGGLQVLVSLGWEEVVLGFPWA